MKRTWNVRLNLDEFSAAMGMVESDAEGMAFLRGFHRGLSGGDAPDGKLEAWYAGWKVGNASRVEAEHHREQSARGGKVSAAMPGGGAARFRANQPGAQVPPNPPCNPPCNPPLKQSTIDNPGIYNPSISQRAQPAADPIFDGMQEAPPSPPQVRRPIPPADQDFTAWHYGKALFIGRTDDVGSSADWRRIFRDVGHATMTEAYNAVLPTLRPGHKVGYLALKAWIEARYTITPEA